MKKQYFVIASILILSLTFCKKKTTPTVISTCSYINGTLRDERTNDACGWLIELDVADQYGNKMLEPTNLASFNLNLVNGHRVIFNYTPKPDNYTPCMRGTVAELKMIKNK
jgi:hypothetical protein